MSGISPLASVTFPVTASLENPAPTFSEGLDGVERSAYSVWLVLTAEGEALIEKYTGWSESLYTGCGKLYEISFMCGMCFVKLKIELNSIWRLLQIPEYKE